MVCYRFPGRKRLQQIFEDVDVLLVAQLLNDVPRNSVVNVKANLVGFEGLLSPVDIEIVLDQGLVESVTLELLFTVFAQVVKDLLPEGPRWLARVKEGQVAAGDEANAVLLGLLTLEMQLFVMRSSLPFDSQVAVGDHVPMKVVCFDG